MCSRTAVQTCDYWTAGVIRSGVPTLQPGGAAFGVCALPGAADVTPSISRRRRYRCCEYRGFRRRGTENVRGKKIRSVLLFAMDRININILKPLVLRMAYVYNIMYCSYDRGYLWWTRRNEWRKKYTYNISEHAERFELSLYGWKIS